MDGDFPIDILEIIRNVEVAEVIAVYFPLLDKTLLVDTRHDSTEGPLITLVPVAQSMEERFSSLKQLRPRFPRPESMVIIPWPKGIRGLERNGVWESIVNRVASTGYIDRLPQGHDTFQELLCLERDELIAAITGNHYETIWPVKKS